MNHGQSRTLRKVKYPEKLIQNNGFFCILKFKYINENFVFLVKKT